MSRVVKHSLIYLGSSIATALVPFVLLPLLTRYLLPSDYGRVATFQALLNGISVIVGLSLQGAISVQAFKEDRERLAGYISTCVFIVLAGACSLAALAIAASQFIAAEFGLPLTWVLGAIVCSVASSLANFRLVLWQVDGRATSYGVFNFGLALFNALLSIVFVVVFHGGGAGRVGAIILSTVAFGVVALSMLVKIGMLRPIWQAKASSNALKFALPLVPHGLAGMAMLQGDRFVIAERLGISEAGIYAVAMQLALPVWMVAEAFNRAYSPWLFRRLSNGDRDVAIAVSMLGVVGIGVGTCLYTLAVWALLRIIVGSQYWSAGDLLLWLMPGMAAQAAYYMAINFIFFSERTRHLPVITALSAAAYIAIGYYAATAVGSIGMAITYSAVQICQTLAVFVLASRVMAVRWLSPLAYRKAFPAIAALFARSA